MKSIYNLNGLRACIQMAREAIELEKHFGIEKVMLSPSRIMLFFGNGWKEHYISLEASAIAKKGMESRRIDALLYPDAVAHLERHHPEGLMLNAHQVMNSII